MTNADYILSDINTVFLNKDDFLTVKDAVLNSITTITVDFGNAFRVVAGVESFGPQALCASADVTDAVHGSTLEIGGVTYFVIGIQPDGTGMTLLILSKE